VTPTKAKSHKMAKHSKSKSHKVASKKPAKKPAKTDTTKG